MRSSLKCRLRSRSMARSPRASAAKLPANPDSPQIGMRRSWIVWKMRSSAATPAGSLPCSPAVATNSGPVRAPTTRPISRS